jgi:hypothetical protein
MDEIKWEMPKTKERPVGENDLRVVNLPVRVIFKWSDKIVDDYDCDSGAVEYRSGYVMEVLGNQSFVYNEELHTSTFIGSVFQEKQ